VGAGFGDVTGGDGDGDGPFPATVKGVNTSAGGAVIGTTAGMGVSLRRSIAWDTAPRLIAAMLASSSTTSRIDW
jgi:hypothetical protein